MSTPRILFTTAAVVAAVATLFSLKGCDSGPTKTWTGPVDGEKAFTHAKAMVGFGPRPSGSPALQKNVDYIRAELKKLELELNVQEFTDDEFAPGVTFRNLWTVIPGTDPKNRTMVVCAHYDTKKTSGHADPKQNFHFVGAMDGAGGSGLLLELARILKDRKNKPNIWLVWFDGEESIPFKWDDDRALFGSRKFAEKMSDEKVLPKSLVLFDLIGAKDWKVDRDLHSTKDMNKIFEAAGEKMGQKERMFQFFQRDLVDDHRPFGKKGVRVIDLIDFRWRTQFDRRQHRDTRTPAEDEYVRWWHTPEDDIHNMSALSLDFFGNLFMTALPELEKKFYN